MDNYYYILYKYFIIILTLFITCCSVGAQNLTDIEIANQYLLKSDKSSALTAFQTLAKSAENIPYIHNNYFRLLLEANKFREAEDYLEKIVKKFPNQLSYRIDNGILYVRMGDEQKAERYFKSLIRSNSSDLNKLKAISDYLAARNVLEPAILALQTIREISRNRGLYILEMANLYRMQGKREEMVREYLNYVIQTPSNISYIKNLLQVLVTKPEELESLENILIDKVVANPENDMFSDLLLWTKVQQKDFKGAFIQARAFDRHFKREQSKTLELALIALNNKEFETADKCYAFVLREYPNTPNYLPARLGLIQTREAKVCRRFPVNKDSIRYIITEYDSFVKAYPENPNADEAVINQAKLFTYFLDEKDSAISKLSALIQLPRVPVVIKARAKLDLGDVYLLSEQPWESTLLYSQVEKTQKDSPLAYEAKLRNARLAYFAGDFILAQAHLTILKQATTREIANDALDLSMRISENMETDSTGIALNRFAKIELLVYQNKTERALVEIANLKKDEEERRQDLGKSKILDDLYWLEADLQMKLGNFEVALNLLQKISDEYGDDILADDALFLRGEILERHLGDKNKAMDTYREFLTKFPGSVYSAEARKRYRLLRGDFADHSMIN